MELKYKDTKSEEQIIEVKSIDFTHELGTALIVASTGRIYDIGIERILQIKN